MSARLVYSTESGRMCPGCERPVADCACAKESPAPASDGPVRIDRERAGRKGRDVTVVRGLPLAGDALARLAKELKRTCGTGGTVKDGAIEIQGDHRDRLATELGARGVTVRLGRS